MKETKPEDFSPEQQRDPASVTDRAQLLPLLNGLRVLLVEDEDDAREVLSVALQRWGAEVRSCQSAAEGLEAWQIPLIGES